MRRPVIGITMGDPAGVGPEICLQAAALDEIRAVCRPVLVGDFCVLENVRAVARFKGEVAVYTRETVREAMAKDAPAGDGVELLDTETLGVPVRFSHPSAQGGMAAYAAILAAIDLAKEGVFHGVATAPISKVSLRHANIDFIGHTEIFGTRTGTESYAMMMYSERLAVGLVTCHLALREVSPSLTRERIVEVGGLLSRAVERIRGRKPRIAVLGFNPHAGESGLLGREELDTVAPAVARMKESGLDVTGPIPPDTAFTPDALENHDAHLCLYHDQGLIPFKMVSFDDGVNVTMGLPFPRTSVDHGTAFDIAGHGEARITSLIEAVKLAAKLA